MQCGITPENITSLKENEVFVFGSNLSGHHGAGAAFTALLWGAIQGIGVGLCGNTYALPTKDRSIRTLCIESIYDHVTALNLFVIQNPHLHFLITKVGCGLAGYEPREMARLFRNFIGIQNCSLPQEFIDIINGANR